MDVIKREIDFNISVCEILVLSALAYKDADENEIHEILLEHSDNRINISTNTIHSILNKFLNKLLNKKRVAEFNKPNSEKSQHALYQLTAFGEAHLNKLFHYYYVNETVINQTIYSLTKTINI